MGHVAWWRSSRVSSYGLSYDPSRPEVTLAILELQFHKCGEVMAIYLWSVMADMLRTAPEMQGCLR